MENIFLIVLRGAHIVNARWHRDLVKAFGEQLVGLLVGDAWQDHDLGAGLQ